MNDDNGNTGGLPQEFFKHAPTVESRLTSRRRQVPRKSWLTFLGVTCAVLCVLSIYVNFHFGAKGMLKALALLAASNIVALVLVAFHQVPGLRIWVRGRDRKDGDSQE